MERLRSIKIQPPEDGHQGILFVARYIIDSIDENTYELILADELLEDGAQCASYAYEFTPQAEIIGFLVADNPFTQANLNNLMSEVLHEASFFGFQQEALDEEMKKLKEAEAQAKAGEGITVEQLEQDLYKGLNWKPRWHHKEDPDEYSA